MWGPGPPTPLATGAPAGIAPGSTVDAAAAYAMMALASVAPLEARPTLRELQNRKGTACWATHLEQLLGPRLRPRSSVSTTSGVP